MYLVLSEALEVHHGEQNKFSACVAVLHQIQRNNKVNKVSNKRIQHTVLWVPKSTLLNIYLSCFSKLTLMPWCGHVTHLSRITVSRRNLSFSPGQENLEIGVLMNELAKLVHMNMLQIISQSLAQGFPMTIEFELYEPEWPS